MPQLAIDFETVRFAGSDYAPERDNARLTGQILRVFEFLSDGNWHTLREIAAGTGAPEASASAQCRNLRKKEFGSHVIEKRNRGDRSLGLFEYRLLPAEDRQ